MFRNHCWNKWKTREVVRERGTPNLNPHLNIFQTGSYIQEGKHLRFPRTVSGTWALCSQIANDTISELDCLNPSFQLQRSKDKVPNTKEWRVSKRNKSTCDAKQKKKKLLAQEISTQKKSRWLSNKMKLLYLICSVTILTLVNKTPFFFRKNVWIFNN